ncbi:MAG: DUF2202 domain-containing protein, partial [Desulfovibrio sp.]
MRNTNLFLAALILALTVIFALLAAGGALAQRGQGGQGQGGGDMSSYVADLPVQDLSHEEQAGLEFMFEEEKLARDVYLALAEMWGTPIFSNIAASEQQHMDSVAALLDRYSVDVNTDSAPGVFANPELQALYADLTSLGAQSLLDALIVGATIEDLDIKDIQEYLAVTDNTDIMVVYQNLMKGSRNHLRSFAAQIENQGGTYAAQFLSQ